MRATGTAIGLVILVAMSAVAGRLLLPDVAGLGLIGMLIVGRYYWDADGTQFLEFRADGTVFMSLGGGTASYAVDGATVTISTALMGAARGSIPWTVWTPTYSGISYQRVFFAPGGSTAQRALSGGWNRRD